MKKSDCAMFNAVKSLFVAFRAARSDAEKREYEDVIPPSYEFPPKPRQGQTKLNGVVTKELDKVQAEPTPRKGG